MKSALNAWSVKGDSDFETAIRDVKAAGFDGIEFNVDASGTHALTVDITDSELAKIASLSEKYDLPVVSISTSLWGGHMGIGSDDEIEASRTILNAQLRCAKALGAGGVLIVPGGMSDTISLKQAYDNCQKTLKALRGDIEKYKINVGVENVWNGFFTSPFDMANFIDALDCEYIGAYYDIGILSHNPGSNIPARSDRTYSPCACTRHSPHPSPHYGIHRSCGQEAPSGHRPLPDP